jgi:hypothetical protein
VHPRPTIAPLALAALAALALGCDRKAGDLDRGRLVLSEDFSGAAIGEQWAVGEVVGPPSKGGGHRSPKDRAGHWALRDGALTTTGERNQPLWLTSPLPEQVRIELTARAGSEAGDLKLEVFGDGKRHESGYILILGGWGNSRSIIARKDEHEKGRVERPGGADTDRDYRMAVVRRDSELRWYIDGRLHLRYDDPEPLRGEGHRHFAFNNWQSPVAFDDLEIHDLAED